MLRILSALLVASTGLAAPALKVKEVPTYCAAREGDTLEYEQRSVTKVTGGFTDVVTKVGKKGADMHVTITRSYAVTTPSSSTFAATSEGLFRIAAEEDVVVPAGKFKAIRVDSSTIGAPVMTQFWYDRGIGLLKMSSPISDDQTILKAFTPGK